MATSVPRSIPIYKGGLWALRLAGLTGIGEVPAAGAVSFVVIEAITEQLGSVRIEKVEDGAGVKDSSKESDDWTMTGVIVVVETKLEVVSYV
jgi:hypothetical protein